MKKLLFVVALFSSSLSFAWEHPNNPDRFPSIGLSLTGESGSGTYKTLGVSQDLKGTGSTLALDTRLPLSNSFTLSLALGGTSTSQTADENRFFSGAKTESSGGFFNISGRYYFNH